MTESANQPSSSPSSGANNNDNNSVFPRRYLFIIIIIAVSTFSVLLAIRYTTGTFNPFYLVVSNSMVPTFQAGDLLVVHYAPGNTTLPSDKWSFENLQVGDIILFKTPGRYIPTGQHVYATHRVAKIDIGSSQTDERIITTKGDANPKSYQYLDYPIMKANYIGKIMFVIPKVGVPFLSEYIYISVGAAIVIVSTVIGVILYLQHKKKRK